MPALSAVHACAGSSRSALTFPHFRQRIRYPRRVWTTYAEVGVWLQPPSTVGFILVPPHLGRYTPSQLLSSRRVFSSFSSQSAGTAATLPCLRVACYKLARGSHGKRR